MCRCSAPAAPEARAIAGTRSDSEKTPTVRAIVCRAGRCGTSGTTMWAGSAGTGTAEARTVSAGRATVARDGASGTAAWKAAQSGSSATANTARMASA